MATENCETAVRKWGSYSKTVAVRMTPGQLELIDRLRVGTGSRSDVVRWALAHVAEVVERSGPEL